MFGSDERAVRELDDVNAHVCAAQRRMLSLIAQVDRLEAWGASGARDTAHWLSMRYGISSWKAQRWVAAAYALEGLPRLSSAFSRGEIGLDKVMELTRFATAETEAGLIGWAQEVACGAIRHRGDLALRRSASEVLQAEQTRSVSWWYTEEGRRFGLEADLPAAQGAIVAQALERMAQQIPAMPDEDEGAAAASRRADALVGLCSAHIAQDTDQDRATVVIHAQVDGAGELDAGESEDGGVIDPPSVERLACNARTQTLWEDRTGNVVGLGRMMREPSAWMLRQIRYRDRGCRFPGCGTRSFTQAHHIRWWSRGGRTDLDNLLLVCSFHHRLVHEYGWSIERESGGAVHWLRPQGVRYRAGPSPGSSLSEVDPSRLLTIG